MPPSKQRELFSPTVRRVLARLRGGARLYIGRHGALAWLVEAGKSEPVRVGTARRLRALQMIEPFRRRGIYAVQPDLRQKLTQRGRRVEL